MTMRPLRDERRLNVPSPIDPPQGAKLHCSRKFQRRERSGHFPGCLARTSHGGPPMTDPRDFDRRMDMERQAEMERTTGTSTPWGWIAAAAFVIVILALVFAGGENTRTAREDASPPATTGMAPRTTPPTV